MHLLEKNWEPPPNTRRLGRERQRTREDWDRSLKLRWAVIKMEKDEQATKERGNPEIERLAEEEPKNVKSVNEMLKEMRMAENAKDEPLK